MDITLWIIVAESSGLPQTISADPNSTAVDRSSRLAIPFLSYHLVVHSAVVEAGVWKKWKNMVYFIVGY